MDAPPGPVTTHSRWTFGDRHDSRRAALRCAGGSKLDSTALVANGGVERQCPTRVRNPVEVARHFSASAVYDADDLAEILGCDCERPAAMDVIRRRRETPTRIRAYIKLTFRECSGLLRVHYENVALALRGMIKRNLLSVRRPLRRRVAAVQFGNLLSRATIGIHHVNFIILAFSVRTEDYL